MRYLPGFTVCMLLLVGCSKTPPPQQQDTGDSTTPTDATTAERARLVAALKSSNSKARQEAMDELAAWVDSDPPTVAALVELLKDKTTAGPGKTLPTQINSTREAAVRTLLRAGAKGEQALKEQGLAALRAGLSDPSPAVREHTAYTIGLLKSLGQPLSADVMKLCTHSDPLVRGAAFDALRAIGITDVPGFVVLLTHEDLDIAQLAAEQVSRLSVIPPAAIPTLIAALDRDDHQVRTAAATALGRAGSTSGREAAAALAEVLKKAFATPYNPTTAYDPKPQEKYWEALRRIGEPATESLTELLAQEHPIMRASAARTLGEIGRAAQAAAPNLKKVLTDEYGFVAIEAACALCRIGAGEPEAIELLKRAMDLPNRLAQQAIEAIPRLGEAGQPLIPLALQKLSSENPAARYAALEVLSRLDRKETVSHLEAVARLLSDKEASIRARAAEVIGRIGPQAAPAAESLGKALAAETNERVRHRLVETVIALEAAAKPAVPALLPLLANKSLPAHLRPQLPSLLALADPDGKPTVAALITASSDTDQSVRLAAIDALGRLEPMSAEALQRLVALAKTDPRWPIRQAAFRSLAHAGPHAKPIRGEVEAIAGKTSDELTLWRTVVLAAIDGQLTSTAETVRAGLSHPSGAVRAAAAEALALIGPTTADVPTLAKLLKEPGPAIKEAAARCLEQLGPAGKEAVTPLITLLTDGDPGVRLAAIAALARMGPAAQPAVPKLDNLQRDSVVGEAAKQALQRIKGEDKR
jgi:HEAT repeat protein